MIEDMPRIEAVSIVAPLTLRIRWRDLDALDDVDLSEWIADGGDVLTPLSDPDVFGRARVVSHGAAVAWDDGDLAIDAEHLQRLAAR